ncbi:MAG: hypothetical protein ACI8QZ_000270 [Chlamydiales bacterium]|jgi:hypothetical protein
MDPVTGFATFLLLTVVLLIVDVTTGLKGLLRIHLPCVMLTVVSLGVAIYFAERLGELYDIREAGMITPIHLALAKGTTAAYLLPVITGIRTLRDRSRRRTHRHVAFSVLALTVLTAGTGMLMILNSPRVDAAPAIGAE